MVYSIAALEAVVCLLQPVSIAVIVTDIDAQIGGCEGVHKAWERQLVLSYTAVAAIGERDVDILQKVNAVGELWRQFFPFSFHIVYCKYK